MSDTPYPRDMVGYGRNRPHPHWPGDARIAVQFVINYEEGAENSVLHGDAGSETLLTEFGFVEPRIGERALPIESMYEFGSRVGFWRLHRLFTERAVPVTVFGVAMALQRNPDAVAAMVEAEWEIASHGYRWIDYHTVPEAEERAHIEKVIAIQTELTGTRPLGYFLGRRSPRTVRLVAEEGGFLYSCQRRLKIQPKGGAKDCQLGWWSALGVRLGVGDAVRGFFGGSGQRSHAELKRSAPAGRPQGGMVYRVGVGLATRASGARCRPGPGDGVPQFSYRHCFCGRGFG